ncbi:MAG: glycosyltransferase [Clostridium paraputrificum]|nr:glycosyltransferase [Clostridium paraputrificum]MDY4721990.1 glycosyltransferase [Clostridium paraputrificum]
MNKFSVILPTLNRENELEDCIKSLIFQTYNNIEIIIVDQSDNDLTKNVVEKYMMKNHVKIKYIKSNIKSLSNARNIAISESEGDYILLADDDAVYNENYIMTANRIINQGNDELIISGVILTKENRKPFVKYSIAKDQEILNINKVLKISLSASLVINIKLFKDIGLFDENFGIGGKFGAAEESDFIIRCIKNNYKVIHCKEMVLYHPVAKKACNEESLRKVYSYAVGTGALVKKHLYYNRNYNLINKAIRLIMAPIIKIFLSFNDKDERLYQITRLKGHISGFLQYRRI